MRYEPDHKTQTRDRIVRNASRKIRSEGLSGPNVASLMKASGLTVGGFYKHFESKDELIADAVALGFSEFSEQIQSSLKNVPREDWWKEIVRWYLSPGHCNHSDTGCPITALGPEIARSKLSIRKRIAAQVQGLMEQWVEFMPGATAAEREQNLYVIFSAMAGAVSTARLFTGPAARQKVLSHVQDYLLKSF